MKHIRIFAALAVGLLAYFGWNALHLHAAAARNDNDPSGTHLITITDATGSVASYSIITLHADHSVAVIDSRQENGGTPAPFSSQRGVWKRESSDVIKARAIDWNFPYVGEGSARVDYTFKPDLPPNEVKGTAELTFFDYGVSPLGNEDTGRSGGTFNFTGTRVTVP